MIINLENMVNDYEQFGYPRLYFIFLSLSWFEGNIHHEIFIRFIAHLNQYDVIWARISLYVLKFIIRYMKLLGTYKELSKISLYSI